MIKLQEVLDSSRSLLRQHFDGMHGNGWEVDLRGIVTMDGEGRLEERHCTFDGFLDIANVDEKST